MPTRGGHKGHWKLWNVVCPGIVLSASHRSLQGTLLLTLGGVPYFKNEETRLPQGQQLARDHQLPGPGASMEAKWAVLQSPESPES